MDAGDVVRAMFGAFATRDVGAALALMTEDVEIWPLGTADEIGRTDPYLGHDGVRTYFADVAATWARLEIVPGDLRIAARGVVAFGTVRGETVDGTRHDGVGVVWVIRLREDRIRSVRITAAGTRPGG